MLVGLWKTLVYQVRRYSRWWRLKGERSESGVEGGDRVRGNGPQAAKGLDVGDGGAQGRSVGVYRYLGVGH